jgi:TM2 domain-containing membrane protein YozV
MKDDKISGNRFMKNIGTGTYVLGVIPILTVLVLIGTSAAIAVTTVIDIGFGFLSERNFGIVDYFNEFLGINRRIPV